MALGSFSRYIGICFLEVFHSPCHCVLLFSRVATVQPVQEANTGWLMAATTHNVRAFLSECFDFLMKFVNEMWLHVLASGRKTTRVDVLRFEYVGWVGWGGILTFMYLAYIRGCYAAATSLVRGWFINVHVPCVHTWMLRCCYVTGQGLGGVGWDINVHVPCIHTWMLRYVTGQGLGGVGWDINVHVPCVHDGMWKISKGAVSSSWSTRKDGAVNPQLLQGIRIWQRRWHHGNSTDFLSLTGRALSKRLEK